MGTSMPDQRRQKQQSSSSSSSSQQKPRQQKSKAASRVIEHEPMKATHTPQGYLIIAREYNVKCPHPHPSFGPVPTRNINRIRVVNGPTDTSNGIELYECDVCGYTSEAAIKVRAHLGKHSALRIKQELKAINFTVQTALSKQIDNTDTNEDRSGPTHSDDLVMRMVKKVCDLAHDNMNNPSVSALYRLAGKIENLNEEIVDISCAVYQLAESLNELIVQPVHNIDVEELQRKASLFDQLSQLLTNTDSAQE